MSPTNRTPFKYASLNIEEPQGVPKVLSQYQSIYNLDGFVNACQVRDLVFIYRNNTLGVYQGGFMSDFKLVEAFKVKRKYKKALSIMVIRSVKSPIDIVEGTKQDEQQM